MLALSPGLVALAYGNDYMTFDLTNFGLLQSSVGRYFVWVKGLTIFMLLQGEPGKEASVLLLCLYSVLWQRVYIVSLQ